MRNSAVALLIVAALCGTLPVHAQNNLFPQTLAPNTVVGRLGIGPGPAQAIPFGALSTLLPLPPIFSGMPPFTTICNPTGITAVAITCPAVTPVPPLLISGNILSINNNISANQTFFGFSTGNNTLTGLNNTGFGTGVLGVLTAGAQNVAVGNGALGHDTSGSNNIAIGQAALNTNVNGSFNIAIGTNALFTENTHFDNTAVGYQSLQNVTIGDLNTAYGYQAGIGLTSGSNNTFLGALNGAVTNGITTGSNNVVIGGVTGLATNLAGAIVLADGLGNIRYDWGKTTAGTTTIAAPVVVLGLLTANAFKSNGTVPTGNTGTCSTGVTVAGGATVGTWTSTAICALAATIILTAMPTQTTGYVCDMSDRTTQGVVIEETATTATSVTFTVRSLPTGTVATVANDILQYKCIGY